LLTYLLDYNALLFAFTLNSTTVIRRSQLLLAQLAELIVNRSTAVCVCVCLCVNQGGTNHSRYT